MIVSSTQDNVIHEEIGAIVINNQNENLIIDTRLGQFIVQNLIFPLGTKLNIKIEQEEKEIDNEGYYKYLCRNVA